VTAGEFRIGQHLGVYRDALAVAYLKDDAWWSALYLAGGFVQPHPDTGWGVPDSKGERVRRLTSAELGQLHGLLAQGPLELPLLPEQARLFESNAGDWARLSHRRAGAVTVVAPVWRWRCWLVAGAVHLLVGRQGSGKSTFAGWVVAQESTGRPWPGETDPRPPVRCGMLSLEEPAERLAARLVAAGADLDEVEILGHMEDHDDDGRPYRRPWRLPGDCAALEDAIDGLALALVTIDGLGYSIGGDSHNYANVGAALSALAGVAERTGCAIVGLTHPPKGNSDAVTAAIGSTAWTAVARISWVMGGDPTDDTGARRVVRPAPGSNYRLPDHGLSFTIGNHDETEAGFVTGLQASDVDAQAITAPQDPETPEQRGRLDEARDFVRSIMTNGPVPAAQAISAAQKGRIEERTLQRARSLEGVVARQRGTVGAPDWWWEHATISPSRQQPESEEHGEMGDTLLDQQFDGDNTDVPGPSRHGEMGGGK
jgi:putative DNA primase/helicase